METIERDGVTFVLDNRPGAQRAKSEQNRFVLVKSKQVLSYYDSLKAQNPRNILEIGMFEGGSLVYFDKLFAPKKLVGIDIRQAPILPLEQYREGRPHIKTYYGRSQDRPGTRNAAQSNFPDGIDLVVDDASHLYDQTRATFESIFPLVKPGGMYVIEDWAWSHRPTYQKDDAPWATRPALTNLIFNLTVMAAVSRVIHSLTINENLVCITKGKGVLPASKLDLTGHLRGKSLPLI